MLASLGADFARHTCEIERSVSLQRDLQTKRGRRDAYFPTLRRENGARVSTERSVVGVALSQNEEKRKKQLANLHPIKPGEVRNPGGRPKKLPITEALREFFENSDNVSAYITAAAKHARNGSGTHFKEINDRVEGSIKQTHEHTGADGGPVEHTIRFGDARKEPAE